MNKDIEYIGVIKFFDYSKNHFGFINVFDNKYNLINNSVYVQETELVSDPNAYNEGAIVLFTMKNKLETPDTRSVGIKGHSAKNVRLLKDCKTNEILSALYRLDKNMGKKQYHELDYSYRQVLNKLFENMVEKGIPTEIRERFYASAENFLLIDDALALIAKVDKGYLINIFSTIPQHLNEISDKKKYTLIELSNTPETAIILAEKWNFDSLKLSIDLINRLKNLNIDKNKIKGFIKKIILKFDEFDFDSQFAILDFCKDPDLCIKIVNSWIKVGSDYPDKNYTETFLWIYDNKIIFNDKAVRKLSETLNNVFENTDDKVRFPYIQSNLTDLLIGEKEILKKWNNINLDVLDKLEIILGEKSYDDLPITFVEAIKDSLYKNINNNNIVTMAIKWSNILNDKNIIIKILTDYTLSKDNIRRVSVGDGFIPKETNELVEYVSSVDLENQSYDVKSIILFWRVLLGFGSLPAPQIMEYFFSNNPKPLQLIFLKAIFMNIHIGVYDRNDAINYVKNFNFTDMNSKLLMIILKNRRQNSINAIRGEIKSVFINAIKSAEDKPYIGYMVKPCNNRKIYRGKIHYDKKRETYSFNGSFYPEATE